MNSTVKIAESKEIDWPRFCELIHSGTRFLLTSHIRPDGDSIGSELAMRMILRSLGKEVRIINAHATPPALCFLDPESEIRAFAELSEEERAWIETINVIMSLDTSSWAQLGEMGEVFRNCKARKIVLDHHTIGNDLGAEMFVNPASEATGALVFSAAKALNVALTPGIAVSLFVAIATDTGWFRFSSVRAETFRIIAEVIEAGAQPDEIYRELYENESLGRMRLIGRTLEKIESYMDGKIVCTWIELSDFEQAGALASDSEDIVNMSLQIAGTKFAVILVEQKSGGFKISFRSRCDLDCSRIASFFGGGGHKRAAGASIVAPLKEAKEKVLEKIFSDFLVMQER